MSFFWVASALSALSIGALHASAYDNSRRDNLAVYWGQNSYGATHLNDPANWQKSIGYYCQDDTIDAIPVAFLNVFTSTGGYPSLNLANICNTDDSGVFPGTSMPNCTFLASDIEYCQSRGKIVTLSLGGATGAVAFTSSAQASAFGDTIWNVFFGGSDSVRPFGDAVLDGIDLDIEGGTTAYYDSFINRIRELASGAEKPFYLTAAPQCPYPDAYLGTILNQVSFDAVYVQFYNNWCGLQNFDNIWAWDFNSWDNWAKTVSVNPDVKIYIGAPASSTAAGSGYVDATTLANIALETRNDYSSFGGIMLWDASQAYANDRYDTQIKNAIRIGSGGSSSSSSTGTAPTGSSSTSRSGSASSTSATNTRTSSSATSTARTTASGTSTATSTRISATGTSTRATSTGTGASNTSTRASTTSTRASTTSTRASTTSSRASTTSTRASTTSTRASTTSTRASTSNTRASTTSTRASTSSTRASTTTSRSTTAGTRTSTTTSATSTSTGGVSACSGVKTWATGTAYVGGDKVTYNGHLWTAKWWSYNDTPGGPAGVWSDNGSC